jgi:hypothetical protein
VASKAEPRFYPSVEKQSGYSSAFDKTSSTLNTFFPWFKRLINHLGPTPTATLQSRIISDEFWDRENKTQNDDLFSFHDTRQYDFRSKLYFIRRLLVFKNEKLGCIFSAIILKILFSILENIFITNKLNFSGENLSTIGKNPKLILSPGKFKILFASEMIKELNNCFEAELLDNLYIYPDDLKEFMDIKRGDPPTNAQKRFLYNRRLKDIFTFSFEEKVLLGSYLLHLLYRAKVVSLDFRCCHYGVNSRAIREVTFKAGFIDSFLKGNRQTFNTAVKVPQTKEV